VVGAAVEEVLHLLDGGLDIVVPGGGFRLGKDVRAHRMVMEMFVGERHVLHDRHHGDIARQPFGDAAYRVQPGNRMPRSAVMSRRLFDEQDQRFDVIGIDDGLVHGVFSPRARSTPKYLAAVLGPEDYFVKFSTNFMTAR